jgi:hypothetical protein
MNPKKTIWPWAGVALCSLAIFVTIPLARAIQKFVSARWGMTFFGYFVLTSVGMAFIVLILILILKLKIRTPAGYIWLTLVAGLYVYFTLQRWRVPVEAVHFLEYGLLGYFIFRALRTSFPDPAIYLAGMLLGSIIGTFDEIIQWMVPQRYWDFRDVGFNALSSALFQVALWKGVRPALLSPRISLRSWRKTFLLAAVLVTLLCLCALNTPQRTAGFVKAFPSMAFLLKEEPMYEFTNKYRDPEVGIFYSRMKLNALAKRDAETSVDNGRVLKEWKDRAYQDFLSNFSPFMHTVLYEFRVHVFRRDRMIEEGRKTGAGEAREKALLAAYKENLILQKYFPETLRLSPYVWSDEIIQSLRAEIDPALPYRSPVSAGSFIVVSERVIWLAMIFAWAGYTSFAILIRTKKN